MNFRQNLGYVFILRHKVFVCWVLQQAGLDCPQSTVIGSRSWHRVFGWSLIRPVNFHGKLASKKRCYRNSPELYCTFTAPFTDSW